MAKMLLTSQKCLVLGVMSEIHCVIKRLTMLATRQLLTHAAGSSVNFAFCKGIRTFCLRFYKGGV